MTVIKKHEKILDSEKSIVFDMDHTICIPNLDKIDITQRYLMAKPIPKIIKKIQILSKLGWSIIIHTSRGMKSCNWDADKAYEKNKDVLVAWLKKYEVPWDMIVFGKPLAKFYVDDKALYIDDLDSIFK